MGNHYEHLDDFISRTEEREERGKQMEKFRAETVNTYGKEMLLLSHYHTYDIEWFKWPDYPEDSSIREYIQDMERIVATETRRKRLLSMGFTEENVEPYDAKHSDPEILQAILHYLSKGKNLYYPKF